MKAGLFTAHIFDAIDSMRKAISACRQCGIDCPAKTMCEDSLHQAALSIESISAEEDNADA